MILKVNLPLRSIQDQRHHPQDRPTLVVLWEVCQAGVLRRLQHLWAILRALGLTWKLLSVAVVAWAVASVVVEVTGTALGTAYWLGACFAFILSVAGVALATEQGSLQSRLADLELREKVTCFDANRFHLDDEATARAAWAFNIIGDARSALPLFTRAADPVRAEFKLFLEQALDEIQTRISTMPPAVQADLRDRAGKLKAELDATRSGELHELVSRMTWAAPGPAEVPEPPPDGVAAVQPI